MSFYKHIQLSKMGIYKTLFYIQNKKLGLRYQSYPQTEFFNKIYTQCYFTTTFDVVPSTLTMYTPAGTLSDGITRPVRSYTAADSYSPVMMISP